MEHISVERTPRRTPRKISENVRELHSALAKVLHNEDRAFLIQSINQYQRDRDVNSLVLALKSVLNTPRKREVYPLLWQIIPHSDQDIFHNLWHRDAEASRQRNLKSPARSPGNLRRVSTSSSLPDNLHRHASDSGIDLPNMTQFQSSKGTKYPIKRLTVKRPSNSGFGFSIRGGAEHGVGLYVSSVDENSVAEKEGVLPGDHVIQVNGTRFDGLTHEQAVKIIQHSKKLYLIVRSVGRIPNSFVAESTCKWIDIQGRRVSPPPGFDDSGHKLTAESIHKSDLRLLGDDDERKVNIFVEDGEKLGLMIRGGAEYGLGIFIAGVDRDCGAEYAGLKAGDQILDVNGQSFLNITHKQAVKVLKSTKNMIVTLKDIGRLPFTRVTHDKTNWITRSAKNGQIQRVYRLSHCIMKWLGNSQVFLKALTSLKSKYMHPLLAQRTKANVLYLLGVEGTEEVSSSLLLNDQVEDDTNELYCRVCNQFFSSLHNKKEHLFGKQHLSQLTGEFEREAEQNANDGNDKVVHDVTPAVSVADTVHVGHNPALIPADTEPMLSISQFTEKFLEQNLNRELELRELRKVVISSQEESIALNKEMEELKSLLQKVEDDLGSVKAYGASLTAQLNSLRMVPTLFGRPLNGFLRNYVGLNTNSLECQKFYSRVGIIPTELDISGTI